MGAKAAAGRPAAASFHLPAPFRHSQRARAVAALAVIGVVLLLAMFGTLALQPSRRALPVAAAAADAAAALAPTSRPPPGSNLAPRLPHFTLTGDVRGLHNNWHSLWRPHELLLPAQSASASDSAAATHLLQPPHAGMRVLLADLQSVPHQQQSTAAAAGTAALQQLLVWASAWQRGTTQQHQRQARPQPAVATAAAHAACGGSQQSADAAELRFQLQRHAPGWVTLVQDVEAADLVLLQAPSCAAAVQHEQLLATLAAAHVPFAIWQHSVADCLPPQANSSTLQQQQALWQQQLQLWEQAVLVISPAALESVVQQHSPDWQPRLRLWSAPWGVPGLAKPAATPTAAGSQGSVLVTAASMNGGSEQQHEQLRMVLQAAQEAGRHVLVPHHLAALLQLVCGPLAHQSSPEQQAGQQHLLHEARRGFCRHVTLSEAEPSQLLQPAVRGNISHLVLLESSGLFCDAAAISAAAANGQVAMSILGSPAQQQELHLTQAHRWLQPLAAFIASNQTPAALAKQLTAWMQPSERHKLPDQQAQLLKGLMSWHSLAPAVFQQLSEQLHRWHTSSSSVGTSSTSTPGLQLPEHFREHDSIAELATACIQQRQRVVAWNSSSQQVLVLGPGADGSAESTSGGQPQQCGPCELPLLAAACRQGEEQQTAACMPGVLISTMQRSIGLCTDAAVYAHSLGGVIVPECCLAATKGQEQRPLSWPAAGNGSISGQARPTAWLPMETASVGVIEAWSHLPDSSRPDIWFSINPETLNKANQATNFLLHHAQLLLCKTRDCYHRMQAWLQHSHYGRSDPHWSLESQSPDRAVMRVAAQHEPFSAASTAAGTATSAGRARHVPRLLFTHHTTPDPLAGFAAGQPSGQHRHRRRYSRNGQQAGSARRAAPDFTQFLHMAGKSGLKHTTELIHAWALNPDLPLLTVVTSQASHSQLLQQYHDRAIGGLSYSPGNIRLLTQQLSRSEHDALLGSIGIHICTSSKEGFGHYMNQARAVGALLLATDYPPMREFVGEQEEFGMLCPFDSIWLEQTELLGQAVSPYQPRVDVHFEPQHVAACARRALALPVRERMAKGAAARQQYLAELQQFKAAMKDIKGLSLQQQRLAADEQPGAN